jgi:hypothetical protein
VSAGSSHGGPGHDGGPLDLLRAAGVPAELARHAEAFERGRTLLRTDESRIVLDEPFLLASRSEGRVLELTIRRVTAFAFLLSGVIGTFLLVGAAPPMIAAVVAIWIAGSIAARVFLRRRRAELGRVLLDFERSSLYARTLSGAEHRAPLSRCRVLTEPSEDGEAPVWILMHLTDVPGTGRPIRLRLGRGSDADVDRVLTVLRRHHVPVERHASTPD